MLSWHQSIDTQSPVSEPLQVRDGESILFSFHIESDDENELLKFTKENRDRLELSVKIALNAQLFDLRQFSVQRGSVLLVIAAAFGGVVTYKQVRDATIVAAKDAQRLWNAVNKAVGSVYSEFRRRVRIRGKMGTGTV